MTVYVPITGLTALAEASIKGDDLTAVVDVHDTTQALTGSTKKITLADLRTALLAGSNGAFNDDAVLKLHGNSYTFPASQVANGFLKTDGSGNLTWVSEHSTISLAQLSDVALTSPATGQFLAYSGGLWVNRVIVTADVSDLTSAATGITQLGTVSTGVWNATAITWAKVNPTGSSLADLTTRSAADLSSGTLPDARFPATLPVASGVNLTALNASALGSGNVPYPRMPTGNGPWDTGVGTTITITRALTVSGTLTGALTGNASTATALQNARTIGGVSFDGTANITVASATAGFTVSGGALALGANDLTMTGSIGATGARLTKGWFTDLQVTNAIAGSVTGSAATWTTARNLAGNSVDGSTNVAFANKFIVQGTADAGLSAAQFLGALGTGIVKNTTTTGVLSIAVAGDFPTLNQNTTGSAATLTTPRAINGVNFDGSAAITVTAAAGTLTGTTLNATVVTSSLTAIGTLASGAVPASLVTAGTFGAGSYTFQSGLTVSGAATLSSTLDVTSNTTVLGYLKMSASAVTTGVSAGEIALSSAAYLRGKVGAASKRLIGVNGGETTIEIDLDAVGSRFSGTLAVTGATTFASTVQLANNTSLLGRNNANNANLDILKITSTDFIVLGPTGTNMKFGSGVLCMNHEITASSGSAELIFTNTKGVRSVNAAGTNTLRLISLSASDELTLGAQSFGIVITSASTRTTIGANGAATALTALPLGYIDFNIGGTAVQIPYYNRGA